MLKPILWWKQFTKKIKIYPKGYAKALLTHPWVQEIEGFSLPEPTVINLKHAVITVPFFIDGESALGGVYDESGEHVTSSHHCRRSKYFTANTEKILKKERLESVKQIFPGNYVYLGWYFEHYGHFLLESLARSWVLHGDRNWKKYKFIFHYHGDLNNRNDKYLCFFEKLNLNRSQFLFIDQDIRVENLLVPNQQAVLARGLSEQVLALYRKIAMHYELNDRAKKLYISRRLLSGIKRRAVNEVQVEQYYKSKGFTIIHPQFMTFDEQLYHYTNAVEMAGCDGTGLHNVLFAKNCMSMIIHAHCGRIPDILTQQVLNNSTNTVTLVCMQPWTMSKNDPTHYLPFWIDEIYPDAVTLQRTNFQKYKQIFNLYWINKNSLTKVDLKNLIKVYHLSEEEELMLRSLLFANQKKHTKALYIVNSLQQEKPHICYLKSELHKLSGDLYNAIESLKKGITLDNDLNEAEPLLSCMKLLVESSQLKEAERYCCQAIEIEPENPDCWFGMAQVMSNQGLYKEALGYIERACKLYPEAVNYLKYMAKLFEKTDNYKKALEVYLSLSRFHDLDVSERLQMSWYYLMDNQPLASETIAREIIDQHPDDVTAFAHLSRSLIKQSRYQEAKISIEKGLSISRDHKGLLGLDKLLSAM